MRFSLHSSWCLYQLYLQLLCSLSGLCSLWNAFLAVLYLNIQTVLCELLVFIIKIEIKVAGEMIPWLRELAALAED